MKKILLLLAIIFASSYLLAQTTHTRVVVIHHQPRPVTPPVIRTVPVTIAPITPSGPIFKAYEPDSSIKAVHKLQNDIINRYWFKDMTELPEIPNQPHPTSYFRPFTTKPPAKPVTTTTTITVTTKSY